MENMEIKAVGSAEELLNSKAVKQYYLGEG